MMSGKLRKDMEVQLMQQEDASTRERRHILCYSYETNPLVIFVPNLKPKSLH